MYNETTVTVRGFVGSKPQFFENEGSKPTLIFSLGVTSRRWSREANEYADGKTVWYDVRCYGQLARNVAASIGVGTPVLVRGRLAEREWTDKEGNTRKSFAVIGESVGIDLSTGTATFAKMPRNTPVLTDNERAAGASDTSNGERPADAQGYDPFAAVKSSEVAAAPF